MGILKNFFLGGVLALLIFGFLWVFWEPVGKMRIVTQSPGSTRDELVSLRDLAIKRARAEGKYKCCLEPPCTMCFWEGNPWNNNTAGTCACDDLIAQGKEPCPQCAGVMEEGGGRCGHEESS
jgi:hypothetical protein